MTTTGKLTVHPSYYTAAPVRGCGALLRVGYYGQYPTAYSAKESIR